MNISVEISKYPLAESYEEPILQFIAQLNATEGLVVQTNTMSTQVFGEYKLVMDTLTAAMESSFADPRAVVMVVKFINKDLRPSN